MERIKLWFFLILLFGMAVLGVIAVSYRADTLPPEGIEVYGWYNGTRLRIIRIDTDAGTGEVRPWFWQTDIEGDMAQVPLGPPDVWRYADKRIDK